ncbi:MAG: hypothetical protein M4579_001287 [Chaenotheca gracillima]|nr:MAG: hypothetical protein M4579_001287 [Chaenotheca gracillima]
MAHHLNYYQSPTGSQASTSSHPNHAGRSRRNARFSGHHAQRQHLGGPQNDLKEIRDKTEALMMKEFYHRFELGRSFDLEDDLEFCPSLLTEEDMQSIHSSSSDRSSLSSESPESSPMPRQIQPSQQVTPSFSLSSASQPYVPQSYQNASHVKIHQPAAVRTRNAIPIVNPSTGMRVASPPLSISPGRMQQSLRRW